MFVIVVDKDNKPLMPTKPSRARRWIKSEYTNDEASYGQGYTILEAWYDQAY